jgi:hypothetical protein
MHCVVDDSDETTSDASREVRQDKDLTSTSSGVQRKCIHYLVPTHADKSVPSSTFTPKAKHARGLTSVQVGSVPRQRFSPSPFRCYPQLSPAVWIQPMGTRQPSAPTNRVHVAVKRGAEPSAAARAWACAGDACREAAFGQASAQETLLRAPPALRPRAFGRPVPP